MQEFLGFTASGLTSGAIYAIVASGLVLTYTTTGIFNFAQGAMAMVGAFAYWQLHVEWGWSAPLALIVCLLVLAPLQGVLVAWLMRGLGDTSDAVRLVATLGLLLGLLGAVQYIWDPVVNRTLPAFFEGHSVRVLDVRITIHQLITMAVALLVAGGLWLLLRRTRTGIAMRASVDNPTLATLNGARPARSAVLAWALGSSLAALSGILVAPAIKLNAINLSLLIVNAYGAAAIGRLRSLPMTFVGALILGLSRDYSIWLRSHVGTSVAPYIEGLANAMPAVVLFIVLVLLPAARLRTATARTRELTQAVSWPGAVALAAGAIVATSVAASMLGSTALLSAGQIWGVAIVGLSMIPLIGLAGQLSLAQLSFAGIGALAYAHLGWYNPLGLVWAGAWAAAVGLLVALPAIRLAGVYLALATGAFAVLLEQWIFLLPRLSIFGHHFEIFGGGTLGVTRPTVLGLDLSGGVAYFIYSAVVFAVMVLVVVAVRRSVFGLRLIAMKDAPAAIATTGINARRVKLVVFALSAGIAGVGGAIIAGSQQSIAPDSYGLFAGLPILLLMVVFGISSPGAAVVTGLFLAGAEVFAGLPLGPFHPIFEGGGVVQSILIGCAAIGLARNPSGLLPAIRRGVAVGVRRRSHPAEPPDLRETAVAPELIGLTERPNASALAQLDDKLGLPARAFGEPSHA